MDYLLPDEATMRLMREEYAKMGVKNASIFACDDPLPTRVDGRALTFSFETLILFLYIMRFLGYNSKYGTEIYDPYGSMGRIQPGASAFRVVNNLL